MRVYTLENWKRKHINVMKLFLQYLNKVSNKFILKDGTALMMCYNLDRFSEDLDFDGYDYRFFEIVDGFVKWMVSNGNNINYRRAKNTDTVKRAFIHYGGEKPLKIEVSYRNKGLLSNKSVIISGIIVYDIETLMEMKVYAFTQRDKIRDLYDISFIYNNYKRYLNSMIIDGLRDAIFYKGIEQFDYLIANQKDDLVDNNLLADRFLTMYYDLGLE